MPHAGYLAKHDLRFMLNLKLTHTIVRLLDTIKTPNKVFLELGPGCGALTRSLLTRPSLGVLGVEIDPKYNTLLEQIAQHTEGKFRWCNADVLATDEDTLIHQHFGAAAVPTIIAAPPPTDPSVSLTQQRQLQADNHARWARSGAPQVEAVGNLPFDMASHLAMRFALDCSRKRGLFRFGRVPVHLFFQQEVAERLTALPGTREYGRHSVVLQNVFRMSIRRTFFERTYYPVTEQRGALLTLEPRADPIVDVDGNVLNNFTDLILKPSARRVSVLQGLQQCVPYEVALYMLAETGIDASVVPLQLSVADIGRLALLWQRFLEATHQPPPHDRVFDDVASLLRKRQASEGHDFARDDYDAQWEKQNAPASATSWDDEPESTSCGASATSASSERHAATKQESRGGRDVPPSDTRATGKTDASSQRRSHW